MTEEKYMKNVLRIALVLLTFGMLTACGDDDDNLTAVRQLTLYGTTLGTTILGPSDLVLLNPTTGAYIRTIGSVGYNVNGLEYDRTTGKLYGTTGQSDPDFPNGLIEINQTTGLGTPIGIGAGMLVNNPTVNSLGQMFAWSEDFDDLVTINKVTGVATVVGDSGLSSFEHGLAFDNDDILVFVNGDGLTYTINTVTGAATPIGDIGQRAHHGDFSPVTDLYLGIDETDDSAAGAPERNLLAVDVADSLILDSLPTADYLHTVSFGYRWIFVSM